MSGGEGDCVIYGNPRADSFDGGEACDPLQFDFVPLDQDLSVDLFEGFVRFEDEPLAIRADTSGLLADGPVEQTFIFR